MVQPLPMHSAVSLPCGCNTQGSLRLVPQEFWPIPQVLARPSLARLPCTMASESIEHLIARKCLNPGAMVTGTPQWLQKVGHDSPGHIQDSVSSGQPTPKKPLVLVDSDSADDEVQDDEVAKPPKAARILAWHQDQHIPNEPLSLPSSSSTLMRIKQSFKGVATNSGEAGDDRRPKEESNFPGYPKGVMLMDGAIDEKLPANPEGVMLPDEATAEELPHHPKNLKLMDERMEGLSGDPAEDFEEEHNDPKDKSQEMFAMKEEPTTLSQPPPAVKMESKEEPQPSPTVKMGPNEEAMAPMQPEPDDPVAHLLCNWPTPKPATLQSKLLELYQSYGAQRGPSYLDRIYSREDIALVLRNRSLSRSLLIPVQDGEVALWCITEVRQDGYLANCLRSRFPNHAEGQKSQLGSWKLMEVMSKRYSILSFWHAWSIIIALQDFEDEADTMREQCGSQVLQLVQNRFWSDRLALDRLNSEATLLKSI